jgi:hypothetical protein
MPALASHPPPPAPDHLGAVLQTMLQSDNIPYLMFAVRGFDEVAEKVDEVDKDTCHTVVLLNCGASDDLIGLCPHPCVAHVPARV